MVASQLPATHTHGRRRCRFHPGRREREKERERITTCLVNDVQRWIWLADWLAEETKEGQQPVWLFVAAGIG